MDGPRLQMEFEILHKFTPMKESEIQKGGGDFQTDMMTFSMF